MMQSSTQESFARPQIGGAPAIPRTGSSPAGGVTLALQRLGTVISMDRNAEIWAQGNRAHSSYIVVAGCVRMVKVLEDGRRHITEFLFEGECFGFETPAVHDCAAEAVEDVRVQRFRRSDIDDLADSDPRFARWRLEMMSGKLCLAQERMLTLGRRTAHERIAEFLLDMADRADCTNGIVPLAMPRGDIGDYLGLRLETACRALTLLERQRAIRLERNGFAILDWHALTSRANMVMH